MADKISPELARFLADLKGPPQTRVPVIVTLAPDAEPAGLEQAGLGIERRFELIPALARLDAVKLIELDSEVRAQGPSLGSATDRSESR